MTNFLLAILIGPILFFTAIVVALFAMKLAPMVNFNLLLLVGLAYACVMIAKSDRKTDR